MSEQDEVQRANDEIVRAMNHGGVNPDDTLTVTTTLIGNQYVSIVTGVDPAEAAFALGYFFDGRPGVEVKVVNDALTVIQSRRK